MAVLRAIVGVLLPLFAITGSWLFPGFSVPTQHLGSGNLYSVRLSEQSTLYSYQSVSYAARAPAAATPAASAIVDDAVILLDVTGSMRGEGPDPRARNIWDKTLRAVLDIVDRLAPQTNLALVPFSNGPEWKNVFPGPVGSGGKLTPRQLTADADREAFRAHLRKLVASGEATWIYESLEYSLTQLRQWREADPSRTHRQALFLYTDGIDNGPHQKLGIGGIVQLVRAQKADYRDLYLVYNDLASYLSPEQKAQLADSGVTVTVGPPTSNVELVTEKLDFGDLSPSSSGVGQDILFRSGFADVWGRPIRLRIEGVGSTLPVAVTVETVELREKVTVVLRPTGPLPVGQHQARLIIEPVDGAFNLIPRNSIDLTFNAVAAPTATATAQPAPVTLSRRSIIDGVPDPVLFLGILALVAAGATSAMWWLELWVFKRPGPTTQLIWKRDGEPIRAGEEGVGIRTIRPDKFRAAAQWMIGSGGYVNLSSGDQAIKLNHAKITYRGKKRRGFWLIPVEGEVQANGRTIGSNGMPLADGSTFVIESYHFRFELLAETDKKPEF